MRFVIMQVHSKILVTDTFCVFSPETDTSQGKLYILTLARTYMRVNKTSFMSIGMYMEMCRIENNWCEL